MLVDLSLKVTKDFMKKAMDYGKKDHLGHLGTHFDVMNKEFPLEYTRRDAIVFDVSHIVNRDIDTSDIDITKIKENMFIAFYTGLIKEHEYGTDEYFNTNKKLSQELIKKLIEKKASIIAIDCPGIRCGKEHDIADQYCADNNAFVVENVYNLDKILNGEKFKEFKANTYPVNFEAFSGLPCRVIGEI